MNPAQAILVILIRIYRWILSPAKTLVFGPLGRCRFTPSCSLYAMQAIQEYGAGWGLWLFLKRLSRCHPWGGCGHDPVPPRTLSPECSSVWRPRRRRAVVACHQSPGTGSPLVRENA